ncbi:MAG: CerR family C-terminal domain-containing protein [Phycisphaerae bacterium]|nr:CerR family C-terminal domain-containing protein [Phycisphaerae bacterium]
MGLDHKIEGEVSEHCRERLLAVAERLFAVKGFAETSVRDITRQSHCNIAAINYHFQGKENLYMEVYRRHLVKMRDARIRSIDVAMDPAKGAVSLERLVRGFSEAFIESLTDSKHGMLFCDLMSREMLDPHLPSEMFIVDYVHPVQSAFYTALEKMYPDLNSQTAMMCVFSLVGQLRHFVMAKSGFGKRNEENSLFPDISKLIDHIVTFSVAGVKAAINTK